LETNPVFLPGKTTPTKIPAQLVEDPVNMNSMAEEGVPGIMHLADFVFEGSVLPASFTKRGTIRGSATG
jgi:hypothetical protein